MMGRYCRFLLCLFLLPVFTGCFTGIESTPKITASDVKRERVVATEEDSFLSEINPQRFSEWTKGKRFYVTDDKIMLALEPMQNPPKGGDYITYDSFRPVTSLTGTKDTELVFLDKNGVEVVYRMAVSPETLEGRSRIEIPFTIDTDIVDEVSRQLKGKTLYLRNSVRYDNSGNAFSGVKFVPVTVKEVLPGNMVYQIMLRFAVDGDESPDAYLFLNVGDAGRTSRNFASLFYLSDPHLKYPEISDDVWEKIKHGLVAVYMTREECRLSLGAPASVSRRNAISTLQELWSYPNGNYLIFEDGILKSVGR